MKAVIFTVALLTSISAATAQSLFQIHIGKKHNTYRCDKVGIQKNKHHHFTKKEREAWESHVHGPDPAKVFEMNHRQPEVALEAELKTPAHELPHLEEKNDFLPLPHPVYFIYDKDDLAFDDDGQIDLALRHMKKGKKIVLEGHTDGNGSLRYNMKLSEKRAKKVKDMMIERGEDINEKDIEIIGYGKTKPAVENDSPEHRQDNRRVVFLVMD